MRCVQCGYRGPARKSDLDDIDLCKKKPFLRSIAVTSFIDMTKNVESTDLPLWRCPKCGNVFTEKEVD